MKIALVILHADPTRGGAERYTIDLAQTLSRRGHDVALLASSFVQPIEGVQCVAIESSGTGRTASYRRFLDRVDRHLDETRYDIVHAMLPVRRCDLYHPHAGVAADNLKKWNIVFNPRRRLMARVECELLTGANAPVVLCVSEYLKSLIRPHYDLGEDRLVTLFNAVDLEKFRPHEVAVSELPPRQDQEVRALFVAHDFEAKGLGEAIIAAGKLPDELRNRLTLVVLGGGDSRTYRRLADTTGVRTVFLSPTQNPQHVYAQCDFFVLPTRHDSCSLSVLEALATGLPVISTRFNGACEIMTDGMQGFVLENPRDTDALAQAMRTMLDAEARRHMSQACMELRPRLSRDRHIERLESIYAQVMSRRTSS